MADSSEKFIDNLVEQMTLEEKIGQLNQPQTGENINPEIFRQGKVGSIIKAAGALTGRGSYISTGADEANDFQRLALQSRLKIPLIIGRDVIHGCRTIFPIPLAQAAAFNPGLAERAAAIAAQEATACGIKWTFAPMLDIARDPRWGRVAEGNGEDPFLGEMMAASLVKGYQGDNPAQPNKLVACAKHYIGYGSAEGGRDYENGEISEATLRNVYLPPFESAVRAGVGTVMSAFLDLNGIPATGNRHLLTDVLRTELGFDGFVVSDWESVFELINHGVAEDNAQAASIALHAGVDMDMCSNTYSESLAVNLQAGTVSIDEIDQAVHRIIRIKQRAGLFDQPFTDPSRYGQDILTDEARQLARQFGRECMVLLKNEGNLLPIREDCKIVVAGNFVNASGELYGTWSMDGRYEDAVPLSRSLKELAPKGMNLWFADNNDQALQYALRSDMILLVIGEPPSRSGENSNLSDLCLPPEEAQLIDLMVSTGKPVVLVVFAGRPLVITRQVSQVGAVLYAWHPGIEGGAALTDILFGDNSPTGRLPITFPRATGQVPIYYNHKNSGRPLTYDGRFTTRYIDLPSIPLFPFGYGLSYTGFGYKNITVSDETLRDRITISAEITNTGNLPGSELVQLYVRDLVGSITRPIRELKGFQRIELKPGEMQKVSFFLTEEMLAFTRADGTKGVEPGRFHVWIASNSDTCLQAEFHV